jgi:hypothetical protein
LLIILYFINANFDSETKTNIPENDNQSMANIIQYEEYQDNIYPKPPQHSQTFSLDFFSNSEEPEVRHEQEFSHVDEDEVNEDHIRKISHHHHTSDPMNHQLKEFLDTSGSMPKRTTGNTGKQITPPFYNALY